MLFVLDVVNGRAVDSGLSIGIFGRANSYFDFDGAILRLEWRNGPTALFSRGPILSVISAGQ